MRAKIQQGKMPMQQLEHSNEFGGTAACSLRLIEGTDCCGKKARERQTQWRIRLLNCFAATLGF